MKTRGIPAWVMAVAVLAAVVWFLAGGSLGQSGAGSGSELGDIVADAAPTEQFSNLAPVVVEDLPAEAYDTIQLILDGGPYPFSRDDLVFENRERLLPNQDRGYYREYTVITPGESDRGARRIVAGADGDLYYTADHYQSFREIVGVDA